MQWKCGGVSERDRNISILNEQTNITTVTTITKKKSKQNKKHTFYRLIKSKSFVCTPQHTITHACLRISSIITQCTQPHTPQHQNKQINKQMHRRAGPLRRRRRRLPFYIYRWLFLFNLEIWNSDNCHTRPPRILATHIADGAIVVIVVSVVVFVVVEDLSFCSAWVCWRLMLYLLQHLDRTRNEQRKNINWCEKIGVHFIGVRRMSGDRWHRVALSAKRQWHHQHQHHHYVTIKNTEK